MTAVGDVLALVVTYPPEPPIGTIVLASDRHRMWRREADGWRTGWLDRDWYQSNPDAFPWPDVCGDAPLAVVHIPNPTQEQVIP